MNKAQQLLQIIGTNPTPDGLAAVAELTDQDPANRKGIEDQIELLDQILNKINKGRDFHIQGLANIGILKLSY
jgi:hypothetical protein